MAVFKMIAFDLLVVRHCRVNCSNLLFDSITTDVNYAINDIGDPVSWRFCGLMYMTYIKQNLLTQSQTKL